MEENLTNNEFRKFLIRKLLAICPVCKKKIYGKDIDILKINFIKIEYQEK